MLELGLSRPWPEALAALTGSRQMAATAIRDYFAPLQPSLRGIATSCRRRLRNM